MYNGITRKSHGEELITKEHIASNENLYLSLTLQYFSDAILLNTFKQG